ncbi:EAL domain-containing protein [Qipengyuania nanhaisediminis]|uniref:PAS domain S-box-containing protein/diguanylate cyclase (GGDEF) domain-containing protein n=1 Tax=Qipengyuania nanhaisediminis TaxID=604088 RepID=A0A1I5MW11_9SPHN|nr:EAL domain-containing protein [Qipengyuania nanhaisediminis]SFP13296.1 PAS domain S-box-containing protein/diguanylate cyclase (GGDEF) domain-containing protein [Qipengyuania nanhaisediminis]
MGAMPFSNLFSSRGEAPASAVRQGIAAEDKLRIIDEIESSGALGFWSTDRNGNIAYLSPAIAERLGALPEELIGTPLQQVLIPVEGETDGRSLGLKLNTRKSFSNLSAQAQASDNDAVLCLSGRALYDENTEFAGFRGSVVDITEDFRAEAEANRLAKFDSLTGLANRHRMEQRIDSTLKTFCAAERTAALMMLDLDRFKQVNDTLGHAAGDQLLQQVADRLRSAVGGRGEIGRLGGDEFQVLIPDMDDRGELGEIAKKIIQMLSQPYSVEEGRCTIGCSVGVAIAPYDGLERDELSRAADLALYASKNGGRGQFRFYGADLEHEANLRKRMEDDLAAAIEAGDFALEYQPVVDLGSNTVIGLEAKYTWEDEDRGRVAPETFLPIAEGSRLIVPIGEWALRRACEDAVQWPGNLRLSMNISPVQFEANGFAELVEKILEETDLDPARLELELNESVLLGDASKVDATLGHLFKLGVRLTLDQYGTGRSSLAYLRRAPFNTLKIGANFFEPMLGNDLGDMELVRAVVALANALGMETAASGVHALKLMQELKHLGVGQVQGFVYSDAVSHSQVLEEIDKGVWVLEPTDQGNQRANRRTVYRKIGVIHEDHYYDVTLRNLSRSGAMIEGLEDVPVGTMFVLDFGGGQLAVCTVRRTMGDTQGLEFEQELVDDGAGGLCTRNRVSPYELAAAGAPLEALPAGKYAMAAQSSAPTSYPKFKLSENASGASKG